jgi:hypothetical protein
MNGYVCFFNGRRTEVYAADMFEAKRKAVAFFKPRRNQEHMISVILAEKNGEPVEHNPAGVTP